MCVDMDKEEGLCQCKKFVDKGEGDQFFYDFAQTWTAPFKYKVLEERSMS